MKKVKQPFKIMGVWLLVGALLWGFLDADVILISSRHDLGRIPWLGWVAVGQVFVLCLILFGLWFLLWQWVVGWLMVAWGEKWSWERKEWVTVGGVWSVMSLVLGFEGSGAVGVVGWFKLLVVMLVIGAGFGFGLWVFLDWMDEKGWQWRKGWRWLSGLVVGVWMVLLMGVIWQAGRVLVKGRVGEVVERVKGEQKISDSKKNLILITVEAWREDGFNEELMPSLSSWSEGGQVFERAYSPAPWTLPSFVSMMSGLYPGQLGVSTTDYGIDEIKYGGRLTSEVETLAERLEGEGYLTQGFLTNEWLSDERGFGQGMQGLVQLEVQRPYHYVFHGKDMSVVGWWGRLGMGEVVKKGWRLMVGEGSLHKWETDAEQVFRLGRNWLLKKPEEPFFLWLHLMDSHAPYQPGREYWPEVAGVGESKIEMLQEPRPLDRYKIRWRDEDKQAYKGLYEGELEYVDDNMVRKFLRWLERWGYEENSVVVVTSDHGEEFWDHGGLGHATSMYEEQVRVPLIVKGAERMDEGKMVSLVDLKYSMLDVLQVEESERSWWSEKYEERVWLEGNGRGAYLKAVVEGRWKLIWNTFEDSFELYDLENDAGEEDNVVNEYEKVARRLKKLLKEHVKENERFYQRLEESEVEEGLGDVVGY